MSIEIGRRKFIAGLELLAIDPGAETGSEELIR
jgi:hypothetical protein